MKIIRFTSVSHSIKRYLEKEIQRDPASWLWSHKRWKRDVPENLAELKEMQRQKFNEKFKK